MTLDNDNVDWSTGVGTPAHLLLDRVVSVVAALMLLLEHPTNK